VIVEWKTNDPTACKNDADWLDRFCTEHPQTLGVSACAILTAPNRGCHIHAVTVPAS
jgi:hypothetical protein